MAGSSPIRRGAIIPHLLLEQLNWTDRETRFGVVLFVRGPWCPVCRRQISRFAEDAEEFTAMGSRIFVISTGRPEAFEADAQLGPAPVTFVGDEGGAIVKQLRIDADHSEYGLIARPATLVIDWTGFIHFAHVGIHPRDRPEPAAILLAVRSLANR